MKSHTLANKLLALPDQLVFIHPTDRNKAYPCDVVEVRINGIVLSPVTGSDKKGGER